MKEKIYILCKPEDRETVAEMAAKVTANTGIATIIVTDEKDIPEGVTPLRTPQDIIQDIIVPDDFHLWGMPQKVDDTIYRDMKTRKAKEMKDRKDQHRMAVKYSNKHYRK